MLTKEEAKRFLENAPDQEYLTDKVVLVLGTHGAPRKAEQVELVHEKMEFQSSHVMGKVLRKKRQGAKKDDPFLITDQMCSECEQLQLHHTQNELIYISHKFQKNKKGLVATKKPTCLFLARDKKLCSSMCGRVVFQHLSFFENAHVWENAHVLKNVPFRTYDENSYFIKSTCI